MLRAEAYCDVEDIQLLEKEKKKKKGKNSQQCGDSGYSLTVQSHVEAWSPIF